MLVKLRRHLRIPRGARVLEIGSGGRPHERATVLTDRYAADAAHREGRALILDKRPFVIADGEALPFATKVFDYCICMHVLEHADAPARLVAEMERVARAGYIETPTELHDFLFSVAPYTEIHRWFVNSVDSELVIAKKTPDNGCHRLAHLLDHLRRHDPHLERWMEKCPHLFTTQFEWEGRIRHRVTDETVGDTISSDSVAIDYLRRSRPDLAFYWGSGSWGLKRWLYAACIHPRWRKLAKRMLGR